MNKMIKFAEKGVEKA